MSCSPERAADRPITRPSRSSSFAFSLAWQAATTWQLSTRPTRPSAIPRIVLSASVAAAGYGWTSAVGKKRVGRSAPWRPGGARRVAAVQHDRRRPASGADAGQRRVELPVGQHQGVRATDLVLGKEPFPGEAASLGVLEHELRAVTREIDQHPVGLRHLGAGEPVELPADRVQCGAAPRSGCRARPRSAGSRGA